MLTILNSVLEVASGSSFVMVQDEFFKLYHVEPMLNRDARNAIKSCFLIKMMLNFNFKEENMTIEILRDYKHILNEIKHIEEEIENLKYRSTSPRISIISDMPKGSPSENDKMASLMVKFEELETKYTDLLQDLLDKRKEIETLIESLAPLQRDLIRYRYVDGLSWIEIQQKLHISQRTSFRIHAKALENLCNMAEI